MNRLKLQNWLHEAIPLLLWLGFVLFPFLLRSPTMPSFVRIHFLKSIFLSNLVLLALFYLHAYAMYPLIKKRYGVAWYITTLAICLLVYFFVSQKVAPRPTQRELDRMEKGTPPYPSPDHRPFNMDRFRPHTPPPEQRGFKFLHFFFVILCSYCYCILRDNARRERALKENENENLKTELNFLRSQISPHFMFNVLNSMVSLARKQSPLLETSLINMSNLMRYMLYESNGKLVSLNTELDYLKNYIDLQLLRYGDNVRLNLYLNGRTEGYHIEPMLLIPFVENAFKHGISMIEDPLIDISVTLNDQTGELLFQVVNNISPHEDNGGKGIGIGLSNVKRRLTLLYPERHRLNIEKTTNIFNIELQIKLT